MEMHQVRYFLAVCETMNFTRAADSCGVSQPSLTRAIQKLEQELGGPLFRRERSRTHLTELGRLVRPRLEAVHDSSLAARLEAEEYHAMERAPLRLGIMSTIGPARLVDFMTRLRQQIPNVELRLLEAAGRQLVEDMMNGELDVALVGLPAYPERIDAQPLYTERYVVAFPKGHRFEAMSAVPFRELNGERYLKRVHCEFMDHLDTESEAYAFDVDLQYSSEREDWVQAMVLSGLGCSIMPEYLPVIPGIATRTLVEPEISRRISLITVAGRRFSPAVAALVRLARRYAWEGAPEAARRAG